jgi:hypothetical protein
MSSSVADKVVDRFSSAYLLLAFKYRKLYIKDYIVNPVRPEKPMKCGLIPSKCKQFLDVFTKLGKATISFIMSVLLHGITRYQLDEIL